MHFFKTIARIAKPILCCFPKSSSSSSSYHEKSYLLKADKHDATITQNILLILEDLIPKIRLARYLHDYGDYVPRQSFDIEGIRKYILETYNMDEFDSFMHEIRQQHTKYNDIYPAYYRPTESQLRLLHAARTPLINALIKYAEENDLTATIIMEELINFDDFIQHGVYFSAKAKLLKHKSETSCQIEDYHYLAKIEDILVDDVFALPAVAPSKVVADLLHLQIDKIHEVFRVSRHRY